MSEQISREQFDRFTNSVWLRQFSSMAQSAAEKGIALDELKSFTAFESGLIIAPPEDQQMLRDMGIVEDRSLHTTPAASKMTKYGLKYSRPATYTPCFSNFGKQVIMACENLYTPEEHEIASEAARPELERLITKTNAGFGISQ